MSQFLYLSTPTSSEVDGYNLVRIDNTELSQSLTRYVNEHTHTWFALQSKSGDPFERHFDKFFQVEDGEDQYGRTLEYLLRQLFCVSDRIAFIYGSPDDALRVFDCPNEFLEQVKASYLYSPTEIHLAFNARS